MIVYSTGYNRIKCIQYVHIFRYIYIYFLNYTWPIIVLFDPFGKWFVCHFYSTEAEIKQAPEKLTFNIGFSLNPKVLQHAMFEVNTIDTGLLDEKTCCTCELETSVRRRHCAVILLYDDNPLVEMNGAVSWTHLFSPGWVRHPSLIICFLSNSQPVLPQSLYRSILLPNTMRF